MMSPSSSGGLPHGLLRSLVRILAVGSLALLSMIWCLDAILPPVRYQEVQYLVSHGAKGWDILSGYDGQGQSFKVRYLRSSGAIAALPGQRGMALDMLASRLPMLERVVGSDLLAVTRLESTGRGGTREHHWELSPFAWWLRVLAHLFGGVICGAVAFSLTAPYTRWLRAVLPTIRQRLGVLCRRQQQPGEGETSPEPLPEHPLLTTPVIWQNTADPFFPYAAQVQQEWWEIRLNDFPAEPMYTLMIEGNSVIDFETWPVSWYRPDTA